MSSILQEWVCDLGLRHQGVLLSAVRGCDTASKVDPGKDLVRCYRSEILIPFCGDPKKCASFIEKVDLIELRRRMKAFYRDYDHYPIHYVLHLVHSSGIIGYKKYDSDEWLNFYRRMCKSFHTHPETESELDERLNANEEIFELDQSHAKVKRVFKNSRLCPKCNGILNNALLNNALESESDLVVCRECLAKIPLNSLC